MKRCRLLALAAIVMISASFTGCANNPATGDETSQLEKTAAPVISEGETIIIEDVCEFSIDSINITEDPELFYKADAGKIYVEVCITYKNSTDEIIWANDVADGKLIYSGKYEYEGFTKSEEDDRNSLTDTSNRLVKPSNTEYIHYFFSVPEEVQDSSEMIELNITICDNDYQMIVREGEKASDSGEKDSNVPDNASGTVTDGEVVETANAEFYVDYAQITDDVIPPEPGTVYNHYAADTGNVFIDFCIAYKNTYSQNISANKAISAKLILADGTTYKAHYLVEINGRGMFESAGAVDIIPLSTEYVHCVFQVPEELETNGEQVEISFKIDGNSYSYSVR